MAASGATVTANDPVITGDYNDNNLTVISSAQKEIMDVIITIRPEFSNYNNPNHRKATVLNRLERKFGKIDAIIEKHSAEMIGAPTIKAVEVERTKYLALRWEKEAVA